MILILLPFIVLNTLGIICVLLKIDLILKSNERKSVRKHEGKKKICPECNGKGWKPTQIGLDDWCSNCNGTGQI